MFQWLRLCKAMARGKGLNPGRGTKVPHPVCCSQQQEKSCGQHPQVFQLMARPQQLTASISVNETQAHVPKTQGTEEQVKWQHEGAESNPKRETFRRTKPQFLQQMTARKKQEKKDGIVMVQGSANFLCKGSDSKS